MTENFEISEVRVKNEIDIKYNCVECNRGFLFEFELEEHSKIHNEGEPLNAGQSTKSSNRQDVMKYYEEMEIFKVENHFTRSENNLYTSCNNCHLVFKGFNTGNLKRHFMKKHPDMIPLFCNLAPDYEPPEKRAKFNYTINTSSISNRVIDKNDILTNCMKLAAIRNLPLTVFDYPEFQELLKPATDQLNITVNSTSIIENLQKTAWLIREAIKLEIKNKLISVKYDQVTRFNKKVLVVNCQFVKNGKILIRTLGMIDLSAQNFDENSLKNGVLKLFNQFAIKTVQLYSATSDNSSNMIKERELLEEQNIPYLEESNSSDLFDISILSTIIPITQISSNSFQLFIQDFLCDPSIEVNLQKIRNVVKMARHPDNRRQFGANVKIPEVDTKNRWISTYNMILNLQENQEFYQQTLPRECPFSPEDWKFIDDFCDCFEPIYQATRKMQDEQIVFGDIYKLWLEILLDLKDKPNNSCAGRVLHYMERRKLHLFDSKAFKAAMFIDLRFNYLNSNQLSNEDKEIAKEHLITTYNTMKSLEEKQEPQIKPVTEPIPSTSKSKLESFLEQYDVSSNNSATDISIIQELNTISNSRRLNSETDILYFYNFVANSQMRELANVVLATPASQLSVEKAISALGLILNTPKSTDEVLNDLLVIKLNSDLLEDISIEF